MTRKTPRDPKIVEAARKAAEHFDGSKGFGNMGRLNAYTCVGRIKVGSKFDPARGGFERVPGCGLRVVTIDREPGVTPFMTMCPACGAETQSGFYRVPADLQPSHEWYRPDTFDGLLPHAIEHVLKGGLFLREIEPLKGVVSGE